MRGWRGLAAFALAVVGAVGGFAVYAFGWHENGDRPTRTDASVRTVKDATGTHRVFTLRYGDVVLRPGAATQCRAEGEGGSPDLFCTRIHGGRHQVIFYSDAVLVWPLDCRGCGPDGPAFNYLWTPYVLHASRGEEALGPLQLRSLSHAVTYADAIRAFGKPTSCRLLGSSADGRAVWRQLGVRLTLATLGALPRGKNACTAPASIYIHAAFVTGRRWQTLKGLKVGLPAGVVRKLYPDAFPQPQANRDWPHPAYWIVHVRERCVVGVCGSHYQTSPRLTAYIRAGRVAGFFFPVGAEGE